MKCPSCSNGTLRPSWLEPQLPAYGCGTCHGVLLPLIAYRAWIESNPSVEPNEDEGAVVSDDTSQAMTCTRCQGLMTRYRFTSDLDRRLDLCPRCEDVWLDAGEWEHLKDLSIHGDLPAIFTEPWQHALHQERRKQWSTEHWRKRLGSQMEEARDFKFWLLRQPNRRDILAYLADPESQP